MIRCQTIATEGMLSANLLHLSANVSLVTGRSRIFGFEASRSGTFFFATFDRIHVFKRRTMTQVSNVSIIFVDGTSGVFGVWVYVCQFFTFASRVQFVYARAIRKRQVFFKVGDCNASSRFVADPRGAGDSFSTIDGWGQAGFFRRGALLLEGVGSEPMGTRVSAPVRSPLSSLWRGEGALRKARPTSLWGCYVRIVFF